MHAGMDADATVICGVGGVDLEACVTDGMGAASRTGAGVRMGLVSRRLGARHAALGNTKMKPYTIFGLV